MHLKGLRRIMLHYAMSPGAGLGVAHPAFRCVPARLGGADVDATHKRWNIDKQQLSAFSVNDGAYVRIIDAS